MERALRSLEWTPAAPRDFVKRQIQTQTLARGPGLHLSNQLPGGTSAGSENTLEWPDSVSQSLCSLLQCGVTVRPTNLRETAVYPQTVSKTQFQSPALKTVPEPLGSHWWNCSIAGRPPQPLPLPQVHSQAARQMGSQGKGSKGAARAALLPPALVKLGTDYSTQNQLA